jgi:hypothetical protein
MHLSSVLVGVASVHFGANNVWSSMVSAVVVVVVSMGIETCQLVVIMAISMTPVVVVIVMMVISMSSIVVVIIPVIGHIVMVAVVGGLSEDLLHLVRKLTPFHLFAIYLVSGL